MTVPLWEDGSLGEKFQHTSGAKDNLRLDALKRVRGTGSLNCVNLPPEWHSSVPRKIFWTLIFLLWGNVRVCEYLASPAVQNAAKEIHFFLYDTKNTKVCNLTRGQEAARLAAKALRGLQRNKGMKILQY